MKHVALSAVAFFGLLGLSNVYRAIPAGDLTHRLAAFEVNTVMLMSAGAFLALCVFIIHPMENRAQAYGRVTWAIIFVVQTWEAVQYGTCRMAANTIAVDAFGGTWGVDAAKDLCSRVVGPGVLRTQIAFGLIAYGWATWRYRKVRANPSST